MAQPDQGSCRGNCCCRCQNVMKEIVSQALCDPQMQARMGISTGKTGNKWFTIPPPPSKPATDATPSS